MLLCIGQCNDNLYQLLRIASGGKQVVIAENVGSYAPSTLIFHPSQRSGLPVVDCPLLAIGWGMHALLGNHLGPLCPQKMALEHQGRGVFAGLKSPIDVGSDSVPFPESISSGYECIGRTHEGVVLAVQGQSRKCVGILFRPESLLTEKGLTLLVNFFESQL